MGELVATWNAPLVESLTVDHYELDITEQPMTTVKELKKVFTGLNPISEYNVTVKACYTPLEAEEPYCSEVLTAKNMTLPGREHFFVVFIL